MYKLKDEIDVSPSADKEFCALVFVALSPEAYHNLERIADSLAKFGEVESVVVGVKFYPTNHIWLQIEGPSTVARTHKQHKPLRNPSKLYLNNSNFY